MGFDLLNYAIKCHVAAPEEFVSRSTLLHNLLVDANKQLNLTRITEFEQFNIKHIADSLSIAQVFPEFCSKSLILADIGCGAGFPSLVLAMAFPQWEITAIDSTGKKIAFVDHAAKTLKLNNIHAVQGRAVELNRKPEFRCRYDIVTARAVAHSAQIAGDCANFLKYSGKFIFYKTPEQALLELPELQKKQLQWYATDPFELPEQSGSRLFIAGRK